MSARPRIYVHPNTFWLLKVLCKEKLGKTVINCIDDIVRDFIDAYDIDVDELVDRATALMKKKQGKVAEKEAE